MIGYCRVSTDDQQDSGAGLDAQRHAIKTEAERRGWNLVAIEEDVESGRSLARREGLQRALRACRTGEADGIVVAKLDRLSRSIVDFATVLNDARKCGFNVVALDLGVDLSTPQGELLANLLVTVSQWERRIIGERTKEALRARQRAGVRLGRPPVVPDEVARHIANQRSRGLTYAAIAATLNESAVTTAHGGKQWYPSTVRAVCQSRDQATPRPSDGQVGASRPPWRPR